VRAIGSVPLTVESRSRSGWEQVEDTDLGNLLDFPNKSMSGRTLREFWTGHQYAGGNALWRLAMVTRFAGAGVKPSKIPKEIWPLYPWKMRAIQAGDSVEGFSSAEIEAANIDRYSGKIVVAYSLLNGLEKKLFNAEEVMHSMFTNLTSAVWGTGRLEGAIRIVDMDIAAVKWQINSLYNRAMPPGMFSFKSDKMDRKKLQMARDFIRQHLQSGPDGVINPLVLGNDAQYFAINRSPIEMDYNTTRKMSAVELGQSFGYPPPLVSTDAATYNNVGNAYRHLWEQERIPTIETMVDDINRTITPYFDTSKRPKLRVSFNRALIDALRENRKDVVEAFWRLANNGVPINKAIDYLELNIAHIDGGDDALVPKNLITLKNLSKAEANDLVKTAIRKASNGEVPKPLPETPEEEAAQNGDIAK
jgi:phage portal protein BeeE